MRSALIELIIVAAVGGVATLAAWPLAPGRQRQRSRGNTSR
jgi:hypothetical protein